MEVGLSSPFSPRARSHTNPRPLPEYGALTWEPSFFGNEMEFYLLAILTFMHAYRHGGRYMWLWWTTIAHGLTTELVSYFAPDIDNFWHAQSTFMLFGQREPLHIVCLYPGFIYTAMVAVSRLNISERCQAPAMGLFVLLFDLPYDIVGIKNLWWTWHDTDANIRDRHYFVPWTSYYFHMTFACAFTLIYNWARRYFVGLSGLYSKDDLQRMPYGQQLVANNWWGEFKALALTGMLSMPFGICQFVPGYHMMKDVFNVHAEVTTLTLGAVYGVILFYGIQHAKPINYLEHGEREAKRGDKRHGAGRWYYDEAFLAVCIHYLHYMVLVVVTNPGSLQVLGMHQEQGNFVAFPVENGTRCDNFNPNADANACDFVNCLNYPYPFTPKGAFWPFVRENIPSVVTELTGFYGLPEVQVWKRPMICPPFAENGTSPLLHENFHFGCDMARKQPWLGNKHEWFWICGTDWDSNDGSTSHVEYILVVWGICLFALNVYAQAYCYPRTLYEQFVELREFPRYYKTDNPTTVLAEIKDRRVNETTGKEEYLVVRNPVDGKGKGKPEWEAKDVLMQDAVGPVYAERGGLFGVLHDTYGKSTYDRLRVKASLDHATDRLALRRVAGPRISYETGYPVAVEEDESEAEE